MAYALLIALDSVLMSQLLGGEAASYHQIARTVAPPIVVATLYSNIAVAVKRLHDAGWSGLFALILMIPILNFGFTIWIGLLPGARGANRFGLRPDVPPA